MLWFNIPVDAEIGNLDERYLQVIEQQFEDCSHQNGICYWLDTDLMRMLGYEDMMTFKKVIIKAMNACTTLGEDPAEDFIQHKHVDSYEISGSYKLSRFACLLIAQNADVSKIQVKTAQYMLARMADVLLQKQDFERLEARTELTRGEKEMSGVAKSHGIGTGKYDYANFKDAGYKGMYNMGLRQLEKYKGFVKKNGVVLYDRMSTTELAANLFRVTQTSEHIKKNNIHGQHNLEEAAARIGRKVRNTMETVPEDISLEPSEIKDVKRLGKGAKRNMHNMDKPSSKKKKED